MYNSGGEQGAHIVKVRRGLWSLLHWHVCWYVGLLREAADVPVPGIQSKGNASNQNAGVQDVHNGYI